MACTVSFEGPKYVSLTGLQINQLVRMRSPYKSLFLKRLKLHLKCRAVSQSCLLSSNTMLVGFLNMDTVLSITQAQKKPFLELRA